MTVLAAIIFVVSIFGIAALFGFKSWEERHAKVLLGLHAWADAQAVRLEHLFGRLRLEAEKLLPELLRIARWCVHELALAFAALSRASERQAHRLADLVSHKHRFEHRESKNEFLKQVGEYKNGNGVDTTR